MDDQSEVATEAPSVGSNNIEPPVSDGQHIITDSMKAEEEKLHLDTLQKENAMKEAREKEYSNWDNDIREQRYKRLQFLLSKSNMYTAYLVERMQRQALEEQRRKEKKEKKQAKEDLKEKVVEEKTTTNERLDENVSEKEPTSELEVDENVAPATDEVQGSRKSTRRAVNNNSQNSQSSQSSQEKVIGRKSRKRKVDDASENKPEKKNSTYKISEYFDEALSRSKKQKTENGGAINTGLPKTDDGKATEEPEDKSKASDEPEDKSKASDEILSETKAPEKQVEKKKREFNGEVIPDAQPEMFIGGVLRPYQIEGFQWMKVLYENGVNGILADEMGLGKTIQCIALISHMVYHGVIGPFLVVVPLSTVPNWMTEFTRFAPGVPVILYHGTKDERMRLRKKIKKKVNIRPTINVQPVVVTSYEICMNDRTFLQHYEWKYLVVDEGHRIKNSQCRLVKELKMYNSTHRMLLTGTPLQNNLAELWSLLNFLLPEIFDDLGSFQAWFDIDYLNSRDAQEELVKIEQRENVLSMLHQILTPFMLRRLKNDVELVVPPKREVMVYAPLVKEQHEIYKAVVDKTIKSWVDDKKNPVKEKVEFTEKGRPKRKSAKYMNYNAMMESKEEIKKEERKKTSKRKSTVEEESDEEFDSWVDTISKAQDERSNWGHKSAVKQIIDREINAHLRNTLWIMRKSCNHPYLVDYPLTSGGDFLVNENLVKCSGKLLMLDRMLHKLKAGDHKCLIFSQMTGMLDILQDYCYMREYKTCRLDGSTKLEERQEQIADFNTNKETFIFLLSTRAGGLGINLTAADTVIIFDSDWNPQCDLQAQDRCHRIGQTRPVMVYRLVTMNTIDQRIVERAAAKRRLEKIVIHKEKFKKGMSHSMSNPVVAAAAPIRPEDLLELLHGEDHDFIVDGANVISENDLNKLLDRSDLISHWKKKVAINEGAASAESMGDDEQELEGVFKVIDQELGRKQLERNPRRQTITILDTSAVKDKDGENNNNNSTTVPDLNNVNCNEKNSQSSEEPMDQENEPPQENETTRKKIEHESQISEKVISKQGTKSTQNITKVLGEQGITVKASNQENISELEHISPAITKPEKLPVES